jgi:hypothetical protein
LIVASKRIASMCGQQFNAMVFGRIDSTKVGRPARFANPSGDGQVSGWSVNGDGAAALARMFD